MKGVDRANQMMAYYPVERKTLRWYKKLAVHIIHMLLLNSHTLHNIYTVGAAERNKWTFYDFRLAVLENLLPKPVDPLPIMPLRGTPHTLTMNGPRPDNPNRIHQKDCRICRVNKIRKKSKYVCKACPGEPGLCPGKCFDTFHKV
uniref:PiggyBac transposable element-derived protein domain-containing protein n=1 Tax=Cuerna arida TaxID=1464854 RepID=A0A1B6F9R2_9HEMI